MSPPNAGRSEGVEKDHTSDHSGLVSIFQTYCLDTSARADTFLEAISKSDWTQLGDLQSDKLFTGLRPFARSGYRSNASEGVILAIGFGGDVTEHPAPTVPRDSSSAPITQPIDKKTKINNSFGTYPPETIGRKTCIAAGSSTLEQFDVESLDRELNKRVPGVRRMQQRHRSEPGSEDRCHRSIDGWRFPTGEIVYLSRKVDNSVCAYESVIGYSGFVFADDSPATYSIE